MSDQKPDVTLNAALTEEIRKGGVGHNEVVAAIVVMTPNGLQIAPPDPGQTGLVGPPQAADQPNTPPQQE